jgi:glycosyltransferase involved in cell wall biosynthesis
MSEEHMRSPAIVILVSDYFPSRGGTTTQTRLLALEFARRGWHVTVLTRRVRTRMGNERLEGIEVRRIALPGRGRLAKALDLALSWLWLVRRRRTLDAVNVMMDADFALAACAGGLGRSTALTWVTRGDATRLLGGRIGGVRRRLLRSCKQVVLTPRMEDELHGLGVPEVSIIPVPVDTSRFRPPSAAEKAAAVRDLKIDGGSIVLFVGHLQERKGVDLLIRAFRQVLDTGLDAHLVIVGGPVETIDARYVESLESIVRESGLDERVVFVGPKDDVTHYLFAADIFCLPSHREGMPNVLLEAMACGLTCVAPASAGGDELLFGSAGVIPDSNSPADLARALIGLLTDPELRQTLGTSAAARARAEHQPERIVADYEGLLSAGGAGATGG